MSGGGIWVARFEQLFLRALRHGREKPEDLAKEAWSVLAKEGQQIIKDGKALESAEDNLNELNAQAGAFATKRLPVLRALQIAPT